MKKAILATLVAVLFMIGYTNNYEDGGGKDGKDK